jgi:DNA-binding NarL/FixJ family response regulator
VLEVSVRTVEHHVEAAFSKLGIRARWELTPEMLESTRM